MSFNWSSLAGLSGLLGGGGGGGGGLAGALQGGGAPSGAELGAGVSKFGPLRTGYSFDPSQMGGNFHLLDGGASGTGGPQGGALERGTRSDFWSQFADYMSSAGVGLADAGDALSEIGKGEGYGVTRVGGAVGGYSGPFTPGTNPGLTNLAQLAASFRGI